MEPSQKQLAEHMQKLSQLYREVSSQKISQEEAAVRLGILKAEQQRLEESGVTPLNTQIGQGGDMIHGFRRSRRVYQKEHELDFKCQCKACVRKHTITMADRDLLREMKITWGKTAAEEIAEGIAPSGTQNT